MSRSGLVESDGEDMWAQIRWRGRVTSAMRGKRGQAFLRELLQALDDMPVKRLIKGDLEAHGEVCALGSLGKRRGVSMAGIDPENTPAVAATFDAKECLIQEVIWMNDDAGHWQETPEETWQRVRDWVATELAPPDRKRWTQNEIGEASYQRALARWVAAGGLAPNGGADRG